MSSVHAGKHAGGVAYEASMSEAELDVAAAELVPLIKRSLGVSSLDEMVKMAWGSCPEDTRHALQDAVARFGVSAVVVHLFCAAYLNDWCRRAFWSPEPQYAQMTFQARFRKVIIGYIHRTPLEWQINYVRQWSTGSSTRTRREDRANVSLDF